MRAGTTCFLGVNVEGALFSVGDGHYRQGEGEACGTAVEGAMTTTLIVELIKGGAPGLAAARGRHPLDDRRVEPAARGRLADRPGRARALVRRALRPAPDGRLPAAVADHRGADRQRRRRQLQRRRQGAQVAAARGDRLRRTARRPPAAAPPLSESEEETAMDLQLTGSRVLVTGGTRGIGRAIVEAFVDEGAVVEFCARDAGEIEATEKALADRGRDVRGVQLDVARRRGVARLGRGRGRAAGRAGRRRRERQRAGHPGHRGELVRRVRGRPDAHRAPQQGGAAAPGGQRPRARSSRSPASPAGRPTSRPGPTGR